MDWGTGYPRVEPQKSVVEWKLRRLLRGVVVLIRWLLARLLICCIVASSRCERVVDMASGGRILNVTDGYNFRENACAQTALNAS